MFIVRDFNTPVSETGRSSRQKMRTQCVWAPHYRFSWALGENYAPNIYLENQEDLQNKETYMRRIK